MLESLLKTCGLNATEQKILLHLLRRGSTTASILAKTSGVKRPTVYAALDALLAMNLITKQRFDNMTYFTALPPNTIVAVLDRQAEERYQEVQQATRLLQPHLEQISVPGDQAFGSFQVSAYESFAAFYVQLNEALNSGEFAAIFNPQTAQTEETLPVVKTFLEKSAEAQTHIREIVVPGPRTEWYKSNIKNKNHQVREIPAGRALDSDIVLLDGSVIILDYSGDKPSALKISQRNFYNSMLTAFELLWEKLI